MPPSCIDFTPFNRFSREPRWGLQTQLLCTLRAQISRSQNTKEKQCHERICQYSESTTAPVICPQKTIIGELQSMGVQMPRVRSACCWLEVESSLPSKIKVSSGKVHKVRQGFILGGTVPPATEGAGAHGYIVTCRFDKVGRAQDTDGVDGKGSWQNWRARGGRRKRKRKRKRKGQSS